MSDNNINDDKKKKERLCSNISRDAFLAKIDKPGLLPYLGFMIDQLLDQSDDGDGGYKLLNKYIHYLEERNAKLLTRIEEMKAHDITTPEILKQFGDLSAKLTGTVERAKKVTDKLSEMQPKPKKKEKQNAKAAKNK